jgi:hypothetical protein
VSRRRTLPAPPPGTVNIPTVKVACGDGAHHRARLFDLLDGRDIGEGEAVLWQGDSPEQAWADAVPVFRFECRSCGHDVQLRLPVLLAEITAAREARPDRWRPVVDIAALRTVLS